MLEYDAQCPALYASARWATPKMFFKITFGHAVTLTFDPQKLISSSMSQDALAQKYGENPSMHIGDIAETNPEKHGIFSIFGHAVNFAFDLLTHKTNQFIYVPRSTSDNNLVKIHQCIP